MRRRVLPSLRRAIPWLGWISLIWLMILWRLGYPSFWDPGDEAHYAQATREMLASGDWLVPQYNGQPFFDKPVLFYLMQLAAFRLLGPTELAARLVPAFSALGLVAATWWLGRVWFGRSAAALAVLMIALVPATFALSSYAILDMTFTAFLFGGLALIAVAALDGRTRLQYPGYALLALAVLTKGPVALVLAGLAFALALAVAPEARRPLWRLRWMTGLAMVAVIALPWFLYMWWRFGHAFIEGYLLKENIWLYTQPLFGPSTKSPLFSLRVVTVGMLPWTPVLIGRLVDVARGQRPSTRERLLWAWAGAVTLFFTFSHFTLDHYLYPATPALCLLAADAWHRLRGVESLRPHAASLAGIVMSGVIMIGAGVAAAVAFADVPWWAGMAAVACAGGGTSLLVHIYRHRMRPPALPIGLAAGLLASYAVVLIAALPEIELAKPARDLALSLADTVPADHVATYRLDRWATSVHFYAGRRMDELATPEQAAAFMRTPGSHYVVMPREDYDELKTTNQALSIMHEREGLATVTARVFRRGRRRHWQSFVVATDAPKR